MRRNGDDMLPVVDGTVGDVIECGHAATAEEAVAVANESFADLVVAAEPAENVRLRDGRVLPKAWVALTEYAVVDENEPANGDLPEIVDF